MVHSEAQKSHIDALRQYLASFPFFVVSHHDYFFAAAVMSSPSLFAAAIVDSPEVLPEYFRGIIIANSRQPLALFYADYISGENIRSDPWRNRNDVTNNVDVENAMGQLTKAQDCQCLFS